MTTGRIRIGAATGVLERVGAGGGDVGRVLAAAGLSESDFSDPDRMIASDQLLGLFDAAATELADADFGLHFGETTDFGAIGAVSYAVLHAPTVATALANFERYGRTSWKGVRLTVEVQGGEARLAHDVGGADRERARHYGEGSAVVGLRLLRRLIGAEWLPTRVLLGHRRPARTSEHARIFGGRVAFGADVTTAIAFDAKDLARAVPNADRHLLPIVQRHLDERLASSDADPDGDWLAQVRDGIAASVCDGPPSIDTVAERLAVGVRTLQRRLGERGVVYKRLVDDVRRELALRYLADGKSDLTEIAFLVGYSELSAFDRAFRRWTGSTPRRHRKQVRDAPVSSPR
jgi:AraC-like DNA-binding protein